MFGKNKERKLTGCEAVFVRDEVDFIDFKTYCSNFTTNGDWVIPLGSFFAIGAEYEEGFVNGEDDKTFMETYDDDLIMVYRHQDEKLIRKTNSHWMTVTISMIGKTSTFPMILSRRIDKLLSGL